MPSRIFWFLFKLALVAVSAAGFFFHEAAKAVCTLMLLWVCLIHPILGGDASDE